MPVRLSGCGRSFQFGRTSAPIVLHLVQTTFGHSRGSPVHQAAIGIDRRRGISPRASAGVVAYVETIYTNLAQRLSNKQ
jgi:hypothetical protein